MGEILDVCTNPSFHSYIFIADLMSIVENRVRYNKSDVNISDLKWINSLNEKDEFICKYSYKFDDPKWESDYPHIKNDGEIYDIYLGEYNKIKNDSCFMMNFLNDYNEFSFKLNAMKEVFRGSIAGIMVIDDNENQFKVGFSPLNKIKLVFNFNGDENNIEIDNALKHKFIKLSVKDDRIISMTSEDGDNWEVIYELESIFKLEDNPRIGFFSWIGNDIFSDWFYSNYIQLHCSNDLSFYYDIKLNYYMTPKLNFKHNILNPWLRYYHIEKTHIDTLSDIFELIKSCIQNGEYISLHLNEKYIEGKWTYALKDFEHESLIYGYDDGEKIVYLMGYNKNQFFEPYSLSFDMFLKAYENVFDNRDLVILKFNIPIEPFTFSTKRIKNFYNEYLNGVNSSYREELFKDEVDRVYGIKIYDVLLNNIESLTDKKIVYLLYEHKLISVKRIDYLYGIDIIGKGNYDYLRKLALELEEETQKLLMICIKYRMSLNQKYKEKIKIQIEGLKQLDIKFTKKLITSL